MLELMKRREIVVEQAEPWGPIVARRTTAAERAAVRRAGPRRGRADRRVAGVVRVTEIERRRSTRRDVGAGRRAGRRRAHRGAARGAPVRRGEAPLAARDRGCSRASTGRPSTSASATSRSALAGRGIRLIVSRRARRARDRARGRRADRPLRRGGRGPPVARRRSRRSRSSPTASPSPAPAIERIRGVDSDYTVRALLHRRLIVELGRSDAPGRPFLYGTGFEFLERFGLTTLEELPPLDLDVATRLVDEADAAADRRARGRRGRDPDADDDGPG